MDYRAELISIRQNIVASAAEVARELEAGRAQSPFQEKLQQLGSADASIPVRAGILAASPEVAHALLADFLGPDYNVCKVVVPSRLGYSEILLQERGFLLDAGSGPREFEEVNAFVEALHATHALEGKSAIDLEPLRVKLKGPAHLSGLCLLIPQNLDALIRKPALLSTLADQADWIFLAGTSSTKIPAAHRQTIQLVLDNVTGLQNVMVNTTEPADPAPEEWWKNWRVTLSLGLVRQGSDLFRSRLSLLTAPDSELRHYLVESRLHRQLETTLALMEQELQQAQRMIGNRLHLSKEGLVGGAIATEPRKVAEQIRTRLADECENILKAGERDFKAALAPEGEITRRLREAAQQITPDDIDQMPGEAATKLSLGAEASQRLVTLVSDLTQQRLASDYRATSEGVECSVRDAEGALEKSTGLRHKLSLELPDEGSLWESIRGLARPEIRYRSEMPRPTLASRFGAARQTIMSLMIIGTILGGGAALAGGDDATTIRTALYGLMLPLLVVGFLWTYVSFRKKEQLALEKEVEKLQDGVYGELRRVVQELQREQQTIVGSQLQKSIRSVQQQIDAIFDRMEKQRQRDADDQRRRQTDQQRALEQRTLRFRQLGTQITALQSRVADATKTRGRWLNDWITRFNKQPATAAN
jgi:hypothetical protein